MMRSIIVGLLCTLILSATALHAGDAAPLPILVSIPPQAEFVKAIGKDLVTVESIIPPGASPATYDPDARQLARAARARLFFRIGVPAEHSFLPALQQNAPGLTIIDTRDNIELQPISGGCSGHHHAGHNHGTLDPHIWLAPELVMIQAHTIADALARADPDHADAYEKNLNAFLAELRTLNQTLESTLAPVRGKSFLVFHPSWGYFARAYGLTQVAIEVDGKEPTPRQLMQIIHEARDNETTVLFVQPQFSRSAAEAVANAIDGTLIEIDPLASDYLTNLADVATKMAAALTATKATP